MTNATRRHVLRTLTALSATGLATTAVANPGNGDDEGNGKSFGRVWANDTLWRTNVVNVLDDEPDPNDDIYFLHDGEKPIAASVAVQGSPFVSESAPGDRDWNGGQWVHYSAEVTDVDEFATDAPLTSEAEILDADYVDVTKGRPGFGPPNFFVCPLNGRA
jgi:hypothetical protein